MTEPGWIVKFTPFASSIESPFWVRYNREKLETIKLSEEPISLQATYGIDGPPRIQCSETDFQAASNTKITANETVSVTLTLQGFNTLESFQKCDKNKLLHDFFAPVFLTGEIKALNSVLLCVFPELKSHRVLYWMGIPALLTKDGRSIRATSQVALVEAWTAEERTTLGQNIESMRLNNLQDETSGTRGLPPFFLCTKNSCVSLDSKSGRSLLQSTPLDDLVFGFFDPTGPTGTIQPEQPMGWPLRNLIAYLCYHLDLGGKQVQVLSYRPKVVRRMDLEQQGDLHHQKDQTIGADDASILLTVLIPTKEDYEWETKSEDASKHKVVGWELNARNKPGPRWVNLKPLLDSNHLAIQAADLNLKLMKWRMIPDLQVEQLQKTKVLLVGAGTLGCSVARVLMGWGVRKMKILDYGKVSYSNPVRQSLFTLEDCHHNNGSGRPKAEAASDALKTIAADMESEGISLSIPMPGHQDTKEAIEDSVTKLDTLIQECDAVFLLTDTRESRWLPTLAAAAHDKILINAALGLDSWLVMRHGGGVDEEGKRLGCYFCNDIVAPENSTKNRTLDQQCTVTRPGLAPIASAMAAELMVSLLHHPKRQAAPAPNAGGGMFSPTASRDDPSSSGPLGIIPHQIRGSLVSYTMMTPTVPAFKHCTACSSSVIEAYKDNKVEVVYNTCYSTDSAYLENLSGLTTFRAEAAEKMADMEDWDDEDEEM
jgi:ubiquitin-like modifier-activating enzyme ATG7